MRLTGKVALITGASRGIGRGIAEVFAEEGADVAINDIEIGQAAEDVAAWVRCKGRRAMTVQADVSNRSQVGAMIERVWEDLGPIDVLVNNAGIETIVPFLDLTDEQWTRLVDVNLRGEWLCSQEFCKRAVAEGGRAASSISGRSKQRRSCRGGPTTRRRSSLSKRSRETCPRNDPARDPGQLHPSRADRHRHDGVGDEAGPICCRGSWSQISVGRAGQPQEIGRVAAFFASDEASYLNGPVDPCGRRLGR